MTKEKQIEEMAKAMCWEGADCSKCEGLLPCDKMYYAPRLVDKGYRKASEVAREIFAEIEEVIAKSNEISDIRMRELAPHTYKVMREAGKLYYTAIIRAITELKKKYIESEKDDGK